MLKPSSYLDYLETLVVSLLDERLHLADIYVSDPKAGPSMAGFDASPINVRAEITAQRAARTPPPPKPRGPGPHPGEDATKVWGWVHGNNLYERGYLSSLGSRMPHEPWVTTAEGTNWSLYDVSFKPDDETRYEAAYEAMVAAHKATLPQDPDILHGGQS